MYFVRVCITIDFQIVILVVLVVKFSVQEVPYESPIRLNLRSILFGNHVCIF